MSFPGAPFRNLPAVFRQRFQGTSILAVCRIDDIATANAMIENGEADLTGFARAHIAEPAIALKARDGRADEIRSCIACNQACNANLERSLPIGCVVNPEVGLEREWAAVADVGPGAEQRVLVVGAGPAGLEAATSAKARGHHVALVEASASVGGQVNLIASLTHKRRFGLLTEELTRLANRLNVDIRTSTRLTAPEISAGGWDVVVLATGSTPSTPSDPCLQASLSVWEAVSSIDELGAHVVVVDEDLGWPTWSIVDELAARGGDIDVVIPASTVASNITVYSRLALFDRAARAQVRVRPLRRVVEIGDGRVVIEDLLSGQREALEAVTTVIYSGPRRSCDGLLQQLADVGFRGEVHVVGDAHAPRTCLEAVYEGRLAGTAIGLASKSSLGSLSFREPYDLAGAGSVQ